MSRNLLQKTAAAAMLLLSGGVAANDTPTDASPFVGKPPDAPIALPDFRALTQNGETRGPDALRGHPTVLWFFPMAGTPG